MTRPELKVRLRPAPHVELREAAERSGRSLNAEIEARLERSFREEWIVERIAALLLPENRHA